MIPYIATIFIPLSADTGFFLPLDGGRLPEPLRPACSPRLPWFGKKKLVILPSNKFMYINVTGIVTPLFKEGKHVTVMKKLINLWPSIKHKNKINIKIILHYHYKKIEINIKRRNLKTSKISI